jgi:hypothetical protein
MVAEATPPTIKPKRKMPISPGRGRAVSIPIPIRMRIRSLYVVQGLEPAQISKQLPDGVTLSPTQISMLCWRQGWSAKKREVKERIEKDSLSRTRDELETVIESTAILAEEGSVAGLRRAIECTSVNDEKSAKSFASWAAGSRQLVAIARQARGLDAKDTSETSNTLNVMFVGSLPKSPSREAVNVTPAQSVIDVAPAAGSGALPTS